MKAKSIQKTTAGGLHKDNSPILQPENTTTFVLNGVSDSFSGDANSLSNEPGNSLCYELPIGYTAIGHILMINNEVVVFSTNGTNSEIGIAQGCKYTTIDNTSCLNFQLENPIKGEFKYTRGCERIIYFYDGFNEDKTLNFDSIGDYKTNGHLDCSKMALSPHYVIPNIELIKVNDVGGLNVDVGSYKFAIKYVSNSNDATDYVKISDTIRIHDDPEGGDYQTIDGAYPLSAGFDVNVGAVPSTNKSITLKFTNLDDKFDKLCITVIRYNNGDGITRSAFQVDEIPISDSELTWTFRGINTNNAIPIDIADIIVNRQVYNTSKFMSQTSNRLLRGNVTESYKDWGLFQQASNNILSEWFMKESLLLETKDGGNLKNAAYYYDNTSYMRDEVYAFGIIYEFKDGSESPVFHIPGRKADIDPRINLVDGNFHSYQNNRHPRNEVSNGVNWDTQNLLIKTQALNHTDDVDFNDVEHLGISSGINIERWKVYNTAIRYTNQLSGLMAYYETERSYPDDLACNGLRVYPEGNVRHHKMPDNSVAQLYNRGYGFTKDEDGYFKRNLGVRFTNIIPPQEYANDIVSWRIVRAEKTEVDRTVLDKGIYLGTASWLVSDYKKNSAGQNIRFVMPRTKINGVFTLNNSGNLSDMFVPEGNSNSSFGNCWGTNKVSYDEKLDGAQATPSSGDPFLTSNSHWHYISPLSKLKNHYIAATHIKYEQVYMGEFETYINKNGNPDYQAHSSVYLDNTFTEVNGHARKIDDIFIVPFNSEITRNNVRIDNRTQQKAVMFTSKNIADQENQIFTSGSNTYTISDTAAEGRPYTGDYTLSRVYYVGMKVVNTDIHGIIENIKYVQTTNKSFNTNSVEVFGGDTFVGIFFDRQTFNGRKCNANDFANRGIIRNRIGFVTESYINFEMRHGNDIDACGNYLPRVFKGEINRRRSDNNQYQNTIGENTEGLIQNLFREYVYEFDVDDNEAPICENFYEYNDDYSVLNDLKYYFSHQTDWCDLCEHRYGNRIIWSQPSLNEDSYDAYRSFLSNDYKEVGQHSGEITNIFARNSQELYVMTEQSMFKLYPFSQQLQTDENEIYVGSGDFLSLPEKEIIKTDYGYAGNQGRFNMEITDKGAFYVDQKAGKVIQLGDNLRIISDVGMHHWFKENLPSEYGKQYLEYTGLEYPYQDMIQHPLGIGIHSVYDPKFERYIIHKKDYEITDIDELLANLNFQTQTESVEFAEYAIFELDAPVTPLSTSPTLLAQMIVPKTLHYFFSALIEYDIGQPIPTGVTGYVKKNGNILKYLEQSVANNRRYSLHEDTDGDTEGDGSGEFFYFEQGDVLELYVEESPLTSVQITDVAFVLASIKQSTTKQLFVGSSPYSNQSAYVITKHAEPADAHDEDHPISVCRTEIDSAGNYEIQSNYSHSLGGNPGTAHSYIRVNGNKIAQTGTTFQQNLNVGDVVDVFTEVDVGQHVSNEIMDLVLINKSYLPAIVDIPEEYLINRSWTISYSTKYGHWSSFHSYMPLFWYNDRDTFYSTRTNKIWKHLDRLFCNYYGNQYTHMVEYVIPSSDTTVLHSAQWISRTEMWDDTNKDWIIKLDSTYDNILVYNSYQTTGVQSLLKLNNPYQTVNWNNLTKFFTNNDNHYKTAQLRDLSIAKDISISTSDPNVPQFSSWFDPTGNGYIDHVPNPSVYSVNKSFYELAEMKDKYFYVRLAYNNINGYKITLDLANTMNKYSIR